MKADELARCDREIAEAKDALRAPATPTWAG